MKNESFWSALKAGFPVGAVYFGALVGPVMVTGSYAMNYYICAGVQSWVYFFIEIAAITLFFFMGFEHTRYVHKCNPDVNVYNYTILAKALYGPKLQFLVPFYDLWVSFAMIITGAATVATGGSLIASFLGIPYLAGTIIMAMLALVIATFGADIVRKSSTVMTFGMIGMMALLVIITLVTRGSQLAQTISSSWYPPYEGRSFGNGAWRVFVLCCSSCSWALGLGAVAQKMQSKKASFAGAASAGVCGAFAFFLMWLIVLPWVGKIYVDATVNGTPVLQITSEWMGIPAIGVIYYLLMILALISSGAPSMYIAAERFKQFVPRLRDSERKKLSTFICAVVFCVIVIVMAANGLTPIVSRYFQYLGYFGQIFGVIPMVIIWPILRAKSVKAVIPGRNSTLDE